jgi:hypothetical protein
MCGCGVWGEKATRLTFLRSLSAVSGAPRRAAVGSGGELTGRFGYSDLKEAALSVAAGLWALNRVGLVIAARDVGLVAF